MNKTSVVGLAALLFSHPAFPDHISKKQIDRNLEAVVANYTITTEEVEVEKEGQKIKEKNEIKSSGTGFFLKCDYITVDHVVSHYNRNYRTPFGVFPVPINRVQEKTYIEGIELTEIVNDRNRDIAVFSIPKEYHSEFCNNLKIGKEPRVGDSVYVIGNPGMSGITVKFGHVARTDFPLNEGEDRAPYEGSIGLDIQLIPGDSGSPVFNKRGEVIGVAQWTYQGVGYFKSIRYFLEAKKNASK